MDIATLQQEHKRHCDENKKNGYSVDMYDPFYSRVMNSKINDVYLQTSYFW